MWSVRMHPFPGPSRMPRRGRCGLCDGCCCGQPVVRGDTCPDRVCGRDGAGASLGTDLRPGLRVGTDSCIERNAFAAARALDANTFSNFSDGKHRVSFDQVVEVMRQTGNDLPSLYKETSEGGLAKNMEQKEKFMIYNL